MCLSGSWLQERKLSLQQLHSMSDEEWRSLKLPVVGVNPYSYITTTHNVLVAIYPTHKYIYTVKTFGIVRLSVYQCQQEKESDYLDSLATWQSKVESNIISLHITVVLLCLKCCNAELL